MGLWNELGAKGVDINDINATAWHCGWGFEESRCERAAACLANHRLTAHGFCSSIEGRPTEPASDRQPRAELGLVGFLA